MKFWYFWWILFFPAKQNNFTKWIAHCPFSKLIIGNVKFFQHAFCADAGYTQIPDTGQIGSILFSSFLKITILLFWSKFCESAGVEKYFDRTRTLLKVFPASSFSRSCKLSFWWFKLGGYPFGWKKIIANLCLLFSNLRKGSLHHYQLWSVLTKTVLWRGGILEWLGS